MVETTNSFDIQDRLFPCIYERIAMFECHKEKNPTGEVSNLSITYSCDGDGKRQTMRVFYF
jgi:hypothetical protein